MAAKFTIGGVLDVLFGNRVRVRQRRVYVDGDLVGRDMTGGTNADRSNVLELRIISGTLESVENDGDVVVGTGVGVNSLHAGMSATVQGPVAGNVDAGMSATITGDVGGNLSAGMDATVTGDVAGRANAGMDLTVHGSAGAKRKG